MQTKQTPTMSLALAFFLQLPCVSWAWSGKVVGVADGDTIRVLRDGKQVKIRLYGIGCREICRPFTRKAKQFTSDMVFRKIVEVHRMDTDRYERTVALVAVDKQLLNEELIKAGAWHGFTTFTAQNQSAKAGSRFSYEHDSPRKGFGVKPIRCHLKSSGGGRESE